MTAAQRELADIARREAAAVYGSADRPRGPVVSEPRPAPSVVTLTQAAEDAAHGHARAVALADALGYHRPRHLAVVRLAS